MAEAADQPVREPLAPDTFRMADQLDDGAPQAGDELLAAVFEQFEAQVLQLPAECFMLRLRERARKAHLAQLHGERFDAAHRVSTARTAMMQRSQTIFFM